MNEITGQDPEIVSPDIRKDFSDAPVRGKTFSVQVPGDGIWHLDLRSYFFDAYLVLRDAEGKLLAEDDDGLIGSQSRIVVRLEAGRRYRVTACALHGGRGAFEIGLEQGAVKPLSPREKAAALVADGQARVKALEEAGEPESVRLANALTDLAALLQKQGGYRAARPLFERALSVWEKARGPESPEAADALQNLGGLLLATGDTAGSRPFFERALAICEKTLGSENLETAQALINLGTVLRAQGDYGAARPLYERGVAVNEKILGPGNPGIVPGLNNLASLLQAQGEYEAARPLYERALAIREKVLGPGDPSLALSLNNLATLLHDQGEYEAALPLLERALAIFEKALGPEHPYTASVVDSLAMLHKDMGDYEAARPLFERALAILEKTLGPRHPWTAATLNNLAVLLKARGDLEGARPLFERALAINDEVFGSEHPYTAQSLNNLATLLHAQGESRAARPLLERAVAIYEKVLGPRNPDTQASLALLNQFYGDVGLSSRAWETALRLADDGLGWVRDQLALSPGTRRFQVAGTEKKKLDLLLSDLALLDDPEPHLDEAWSRLTAWKGMVFRHAGRLARMLASGQVPAEVVEFQNRLRRVDARLSKLAYARRIPDLEGHQARFEELRAERQDLEHRLLAGLGIHPGKEVTSASELGALLPEGSAVLDFTLHTPLRFAQRDAQGKVVKPGGWEAPRVLAWIVRSGASAPALVDLGPAGELRSQFQGTVNRYLADLSARVRGGRALRKGAGTPASALRKRLWDPLAPHLEGVRRLFVVTDGFLAELPFGAIELEDGHYLLERMDVVYAQDPVTLRERLEREAPQPAAAPSLLALGGVDYRSRAPRPDGRTALSEAEGMPVSWMGTRGSRGFSGAWPPLPFTGKEAESVLGLHRRVFGSEAHRAALEGSGATEEVFKEAAPGNTVLHLATHGFFEREGIGSLWEAALRDSRDKETALEPREMGVGQSAGAIARPDAEVLKGAPPEFLAGLILAGADEPTPAGRDDGVLTAAEVAGLPLEGTRLAFLSACQSALGTGRSGEGLLSLRRAFREAGVETVVATLWKVDDEATRELATRFYENLWKKHQGASASLRAARLSLLHEKRFRDPRFWAAFTLSGEWR